MRQLPKPATETSQPSLIINNHVSEIRRMSEWLDAALHQLAVPAELLFRFDLSANEAVTNIICYAYPENGSHEITLQLSVSAAAVSLTIEDDGAPFNPLAAPPHVQPASLEEASIGGLGIDLIRRFMDDCAYVRRNGRNVLKMSVAVAPASVRQAD